MAHYDITYKCGCTERKQLFGKLNERYAYIEWCKENKLCSVCQNEAYIKEAENAETLTKEMDLVQLTGSEKQIVWATTIRATAIKTINSAEKEIPQEKMGTFHEIVNMYILSQSTAKWWIENRDNVHTIKDLISICQIEKKLTELNK